MKSHLIELRKRLINYLAVLITLTCLGLPFANPIYQFVANPLQTHLLPQSSMIATQITTPFLIPIKLVFILCFLASIPCLLFHAWRFVAPGLYPNERRSWLPQILFSTCLFYLGMAFAFWGIAPLALRFLVQSAPSNIIIMTDISAYLDFILGLCFGAGVAFQVPILTRFIIRSGLCTRDALAKQRAWIVVFSLVLGMLLTPPDVISQLLLAIPMWLLFELGLVISKPSKHTQQEQVGV